MNLKELEFYFKENNYNSLTLKKIDELNIKNGKNVLTIKQKINLCAQVQYHKRIKRNYFFENGKCYTVFEWENDLKL